MTDQVNTYEENPNVPKLYDYKGNLKFIGKEYEDTSDFFKRIASTDLSEGSRVYNPEIVGLNMDQCYAWMEEYSAFKDIYCLGYDLRGYLFMLHRRDNGEIRIFAGCRRMSLEMARKHWQQEDIVAKLDLAEQIAKELGWIPLTYSPSEKNGGKVSLSEMANSAIEAIGEELEKGYENPTAVALENGEHVEGFVPVPEEQRKEYFDMLADPFEISKELGLPVPVIEEV